jgi:hypothetical protein
MTARYTRQERGLARRAVNRLLAIEQHEFPSSSNPNKRYHARVMIDGKLMCDCQGWTIRKTDRRTGDKLPRVCKHTAEVVAGRTTIARGEFLYLDRTTTD